jgi:hypothetical protein
MYCSTCGSLIKAELNYCNRCGARVDKMTTTVKSSSSAIGVLSAATGVVGIGGLALTVGLIAILLNFAVKSEVVVMLSLAFLSTIFGIIVLMLRQITQMNGNARIAPENAFETPKLNAPNTAQLAEPRQPTMSVTENTTRTLEKELVK